MPPRAAAPGRGGRGGRCGRGGKNPAAAGSKRSCPPKKRKSTLAAATTAPAAAATPTLASTRERRADAGSNMSALIEIDKPRAKRSHEEVAAADAQRAALADERARKRADAIAILAALDVECDAAMAAEEVEKIDSTADLPVEDAMEVEDEDEQMLEITQEDFDRIDDDEAYLSDSEYAPKKRKGNTKTVTAPAPLKRANKKIEKYQTRKDIEALGEVLKAQTTASAVVVKKRGIQNSNAAAASSKAGISKSWSAKATAGPDVLGGFTDEDAEATRPEFEVPETARALHKNTIVGIFDVPDSDDTPTKVPGRAVAVKSKGRAPLKVESEASNMPALAVRGRTTKTPKVKSESSSSSFTPEAHADVKGLPVFIAKSWETKFLPEVYKLVYCSDKTMVLSAVGDDPDDPGRLTVDLLQDILDRLYPKTRWTLQWNDIICSRACRRMRDRRGAFGRVSARVVTDIFKSLDYHSDKKAVTPHLRLSQRIANDAKYALRSNGPAFYKTPTPQAVCKLKHDHPSYIRPAGFLESDAIIKTLSTFIGKQDWPLGVSIGADNKEVVDISELPVGALGLTAAAVERAYKMHITGIETKPLEFSAVNFGPAVEGYIASIKKLKASRWESILAACGAVVCDPVVPEEDSEVEEEHSLDGRREYMYIPSSSPPRD
ncbi:hypothetical protein B0H12DRAFT_1237987 [Mycena haematopus]|nr:hypothetical protein B0H12DRAFT_1237987 [Mycena haematopus]